MQDLTLDYTNWYYFDKDTGKYIGTLDDVTDKDSAVRGHLINNTFLTYSQLVIQRVVLALQTWTGDWFLDGDFGIPYDSVLQNESILISNIEDVIKNVEGVQSVQDVNVEISYGDTTYKRQKYINISATIITEENEDVSYNDTIPIIGV